MNQNYSSSNETVNDAGEFYRPTYEPTTTTTTTQKTYVTGQLPQGTTSSQYENAKVVAVAGLTAGALAGIGALVGDRRNKPKTRAEMARMILEEAAEGARKEAKKQSKRNKGEVVESTNQVTEFLSAIRGSKKDVVEDKAEDAKSTTDDAISKILDFITSAREDAGKKVEEAKPVVNDYVSRVQEKAPEVKDSAKEQAATKLEDVKANASVYSEKAVENAGKAKVELGRFLSLLKDKVLEVEQEYVEGIVKPKLTTVAEQASTLIEQGKEKAQDEIIPQVIDKAATAKETVAEKAQVVAENAQPKATEMTSKVSETASAATTAVQTKANDATAAAKKGAKETRSLLMWVGLGATLVFTVFLDEEQQEKVKKVGGEILTEAWNMYSDMRKNGQSF